jgi:oligoendopeptidase F
MKKIQTSWNLGLLYKSKTDPQIAKDMKAIAALYSTFEKKYRGKTDYLNNESKLLTALTDFEALFTKLPFTAPVGYFEYILDINSTDAEARAKATQNQEWFAKNDHKIVFFELSLAKIAAPLQKKFLSSKKLAHFRYYLQTIFNQAKYNLSEPEEKIMNLKSIPAYTHWVDMTQKILGKTSVEFKGKSMPLPEAVQMVAELPLPDRYDLQDRVMKAYASVTDIAESEINAVVTNKKINDELRGYKEPFDNTILSYQNDPKAVKALVAAVTKHFPISHRFYKLKAKLLKLPHLQYADRAVGIGENVRQVSFDEAVATLREVFGAVNPRYREILDSYLENGQIDVFPKKGKTGGAYCSGNINAPTFVLLNHTNSWNDVMTFAHEMGHAIHTEFSKSQTPLYKNYTISTAEVASTLFESFVFDALFNKLSKEEQVVALHKKINDDIQTVFRQVACFNFETDLHNGIRAKGGMSKQEISALMNKHMSTYLGPIVHMKENDGDMFVYWSHIRRFFYVYTYAFGQLISKSLAEKYAEDKSYLKKIETFLNAGGSDSPEGIFKSVGIDVTKSDFWEKGLKKIEKDIETLEKLTQKR